MLSKCANPGCPATFLYLHQGKLFRLDAGNEIPASAAMPQIQDCTARRVFLVMQRLRRGADSRL